MPLGGVPLGSTEDTPVEVLSKHEADRLRADSRRLDSLLASGRLWWDRHEPHQLGYTIKRVPLNSVEDVDAELRRGAGRGARR